MAVAGVLVLVVAFGAFALAGIMALLNLGDRRTLARLRRCDPLPPGQVAAARPLPRRVLVHGRTAPGPDGALLAPASAQPCAWYRTVVADRRSDSDSDYVHVVAGDKGIGLEGGGGTVVIDVRLLSRPTSLPGLRSRTRSEEHGFHRDRADALPPGFARLQQQGLLTDSVVPRFGTRTLDLSEDVVPLGLEVCVLARPVRKRQGYVVLTGRGHVTTGTPQSWLAAMEHGLGEGWFSVRALLAVGIVAALVGVLLSWWGAP